MTWIFGYHLKWKVLNRTAIKLGLQPIRYDLVGEHVFIALQSRLLPVRKARLEYDTDNKRTILVIHECHGERSFEGLRFTGTEVVQVANALGIRRGPRWYKLREEDRSGEMDSSEDEEADWSRVAALDYGPGDADCEDIAKREASV